jgi:hypothetical protein
MENDLSRSIIDRLASIDLERPELDRGEVERAVTAHFTALRLGRPTIAWMPDPGTADLVSRGLELRRTWSINFLQRWTRLSSTLSSRTSRFSRARARADEVDGPEPRHLLLARLDWRAWELSALDRFANRSALLLTPAALGAERAARALVDPPYGAPLRTIAELLGAVAPLARASAAGLFAMWVRKGRCLLVPRPLLQLENGELHCWDGRPAVEWCGGAKYYLWRGIRVRRTVGEHPDRLDARRIRGWANAEVRRLAIERYGHARFLRDLRAEVISEDGVGKLWRTPGDRDHIAFVEVKNSTPERDGSRKTYFLRVPPQSTTAREAVAWTFGFDNANDYAPLVES